MLILVIDTAGADCAVLLARGETVLASRRETLGRGHAERLAPMVQEALEEAGVEPAALGRIGVVTGPGSFAGIRVGVAFARGLALVLGVPALGLSWFDIWARAHAGEALLVAAHDAGRGEIAWRAWRHGAPDGPDGPAGGPQGIVRRAAASDAAAAIAALGASPAIVGSAALLLAPSVPGGRVLAGQVEDNLIARMVLGADPAHYPPSPLYIRPPDAKLPGGATPGDVR